MDNMVYATYEQKCAYYNADLHVYVLDHLIHNLCICALDKTPTNCCTHCMLCIYCIYFHGIRYTIYRRLNAGMAQIEEVLIIYETNNGNSDTNPPTPLGVTKRVRFDLPR